MQKEAAEAASSFCLLPSLSDPLVLPILLDNLGRPRSAARGSTIWTLCYLILIDFHFVLSAIHRPAAHARSIRPRRLRASPSCRWFRVAGPCRDAGTARTCRL